MPKEHPRIATEAEQAFRRNVAEFEKPQLVQAPLRAEPGSYGAAVLRMKARPKDTGPSTAAELQAFADARDVVATNIEAYCTALKAFQVAADALQQASWAFADRAAVLGIDYGKAQLGFVRDPSAPLGHAGAWSRTHLYHELEGRIRACMGDGFDLQTEIATATAREAGEPVAVDQNINLEGRRLALAQDWGEKK